MNARPEQRPGRLGVGVIGAGRVGAVLGSALRAAGHAVVGASAVSRASLDRVDALLPGVPVLEIPQLVERAELVLISVPDDVLPELVAGLAATKAWQPGQVEAGAGEGHRRVQRERDRPTAHRGLQYPPAVPAAGMHHELPGLPGPGGGQAGDQIRQGIVRHGDQDEFGPLDDLRDFQHRDTGQQRIRTFPAGGRHGTDPDDRVPGGPQGRGEHRADPARADHPDPEPARALVGSPGRAR